MVASVGLQSRTSPVSRPDTTSAAKPLVQAPIPDTTVKNTPDVYVPGGSGPTSPFVTSVKVYNNHQSITLDRPIHFVSSGLGEKMSWRGELQIPLAQLGLNGTLPSKISLGLPWRHEASPGEALPFVIEAGVVRISVPDAIPDTESWGGKTHALFSIQTGEGPSTQVDVRAKTLVRDTTAQKKQNLEGTISAATQKLTHLEESASRLKAFIADPAHTERAYNTTWVNGAPYHTYVTAELASSQQRLQSTDEQLALARAKVEMAYENGGNLKLLTVLSAMSRQEGGDAWRDALIPASNAAVAASSHHVRLKDNLAAIRELMPRETIVAAEAERAAAASDEEAKKATFDDLFKKAVATILPDELLAAADIVLGAGQGIRELLLTRELHMSNIALWQDALSQDFNAALEGAKASLPRVEQSIAEQRETLERVQAELKELRPEIATIDIL